MGVTGDASNYCLISLMCVISKIKSLSELSSIAYLTIDYYNRILHPLNMILLSSTVHVQTVGILMIFITGQNSQLSSVQLFKSYCLPFIL